MSNPFDEINTRLSAIEDRIGNIQSTDTQKPEIIDRKELRSRLGISEPAAIRWGKRGKIPEIRIGSNIRYNWPAVVRSLENNV